MDDSAALPGTLERALQRVLGALFRLLLRHGMSFTAFEHTAKRVYVDVALREFGIPGKKPSISRASILSGLTRKEVQRLVNESASRGAEPGGEHDNRAARVLTAWTRDPDFLDAEGQPRVLEAQEGEVSFAALVRRYSGDMPVRAVLDELMRVGAAQRLDDGRLQLVQRAFVPRGAIDKIEMLGQDASDLMRTIDHNIQHGERDARFQRRVLYRNMPAAVADGFRKVSAAQAMALLVKLDRWLADEADKANAQPDAGPQVRLGMGIYYFESASDERPTSTTKD